MKGTQTDCYDRSMHFVPQAEEFNLLSTTSKRGHRVTPHWPYDQLNVHQAVFFFQRQVKSMITYNAGGEAMHTYKLGRFLFLAGGSQNRECRNEQI